jgi:putative spermidine/putrescine transport system ATP-binding protein
VSVSAPLAAPGAAPSPGGGRRVVVRDVWKSYAPGSYAVREVGFALEPGEFLTLLGPSGSGKTTTLMMVAGFEAPSRGEIRVDGIDVAGLPPERRNFGIVFQGYALFPHKSVLDNVAFALLMRGVGRRERRRRALDMLDKVGLAGLEARRPRELSGGQQQRVALARALVFEPDALLLDEPLGALDRKLRETLQAEIKEIQRRVGISILYVTHDQDEAMTMSDRIAVMDRGRIVQIGTPAELYLHPATPFVAGFLGETNLLAATCLGTDGGHVRLRFADGAIGWAAAARDGVARRIGDAVTVAVRPERTSVLRRGESADTAIDGVVIGGTFLGRHARYVVAALGDRLAVSIAGGSLEAALEPGAAVRLGWSRDDAQILGEPDAPPEPDDRR